VSTIRNNKTTTATKNQGIIKRFLGSFRCPGSLNSTNHANNWQGFLRLIAFPKGGRDNPWHSSSNWTTSGKIRVLKSRTNSVPWTRFEHTVTTFARHRLLQRGT